MVYFVNRREFNYQKYQTNRTVIDENYKGNLLFSMKDFVLFVTDSQSNFLCQSYS